jgi:hypothetical protein
MGLGVGDRGQEGKRWHGPYGPWKTADSNAEFSTRPSTTRLPTPKPKVQSPSLQKPGAMVLPEGLAMLREPAWPPSLSLPSKAHSQKASFCFPAIGSL